MEFEGLAIEGAWLARSPVHRDERGFFREWFRGDELPSATGREFKVVQSNTSLSAKGVLRGIHYSLAPQGQAKWITCMAGSIWDVVVDIRPSSPTFKKWVGVELEGSSGDSLLISEGLGHAFIALEDDSVVTYLLTSPYSPKEEFGLNPLDDELAIHWPINNPSLSPADEKAISISEAFAANRLPI